MPANRKGKTVRKVRSIRVEDATVDAVIKVYGTLTKFFDVKVSKDKKIQKLIKRAEGLSQ